MEQIDCILCDSKEYFYTIELVNDRFNPHDTYQIQKCECGMISTNPRLSSKEISNHYQNQNYHPQKRANKIFNFFYKIAQSFNNRNKKKLIQKYYKKGNLLDYGGGDGQFQKYMSANSWISNIYEPYLKVDADKHLDYNEVIMKDSFYDVVSMFHSLEHIHDISESLRDIAKVMKEKSVLIISVPNHNAFERSFFKSKWVAYDVPRHLHHFTINSLDKVLAKNGFQIIEYKAMYIDTVYNIIMSFNSKVNILFKAPFLILNSLFQIYINKKKASSIMLVCNKK